MEELQSFNLVHLATLPLLGSNDGEIAFNLRWPWISLTTAGRSLRLFTSRGYLSGAH
jgi:hypothetical protein